MEHAVPPCWQPELFLYGNIGGHLSLLIVGNGQFVDRIIHKPQRRAGGMIMCGCRVEKRKNTDPGMKKRPASARLPHPCMPEGRALVTEVGIAYVKINENTK
ncbi:hypothetical protein [Komagataeibacter sp. FXV3]|uniref:hypothetical protein n=1 Tax=Komagataeibacter sp. FXV3 TaxID=2608998 RepID=UPI00187B1A7D|nr:hypothetical protein [Komagataeibacter sp. FXV3]MBE7730257.1 hypothetical protein [Komagataeibacter sp. FXV3]